MRLRVTHLSDLSPEQIRLLVKLDDGIDSVGMPDHRLSTQENLVLLSLMIVVLAALDRGRGGLAWARLTEKGRKVREEGRTSRELTEFIRPRTKFRPSAAWV